MHRLLKDLKKMIFDTCGLQLHADQSFFKLRDLQFKNRKLFCIFFLWLQLINFGNKIQALWKTPENSEKKGIFWKQNPFEFFFNKAANYSQFFICKLWKIFPKKELENFLENISWFLKNSPAEFKPRLTVILLFV